MKKTIVSIVVGTFALLGSVSGCASEASTPHVVHTQLPDGNGPVGPVGSTFKVWHSDTEYMDVTVSDVYFVDSNPQVERAVVTVKSTQGQNSIGYFSGMNAAGDKQDEMSVNMLNLAHPNFNDPTQLDESGVMVQGEIRSGTIDIPVLGLTQVFLDSVGGPLATWNTQT